MIEIELSYVWGEDDLTFGMLVEEFSQQYGVKVRLRRFDWSTAWVDLFTIVSQGQGSDVSNIGSTWVSTLAKLDALRPFKSGEVAEMGGESAFAAAIWKSTKLSGDPRIWSIPWISWMYLICYRKDILQNLAVDPYEAFTTPQGIQATLTALKTSPLEIPWLNPYFSHPYTNFVHTSASWVWAAGGDFIDPTGHKVLFNSPQAILGLTYWLETYRSMPELYWKFSVEECADMFTHGRTAATLVHIVAANTILNGDLSGFKREDIGFANLPFPFWTGGDSFVIWEHVRSYPEREHAAIELVKFMTTKMANLRWVENASLLPARMDALHEGYPPQNPLHDVVTLAAHKGRGYFNVPHWRRVESQLSLELGTVVNEARENPSLDSATILRSRLEPLARRLDIILGA